MEAELDLQPSLLHQCRAGPLVPVLVLVAAEDNYNSEPAPKLRGEHSVIFGRTPADERGREVKNICSRKGRKFYAEKCL